MADGAMVVMFVLSCQMVVVLRGRESWRYFAIDLTQLFVIIWLTCAVVFKTSITLSIIRNREKDVDSPVAFIPAAPDFAMGGWLVAINPTMRGHHLGERLRALPLFPVARIVALRISNMLRIFANGTQNVGFRKLSRPRTSQAPSFQPSTAAVGKRGVGVDYGCRCHFLDGTVGDRICGRSGVLW